MSDGLSNWQSPDGERNAHALRAKYSDVFHAVSEFDRIGHLLLFRAGQQTPLGTMEQIVGLALVRRGVTVFAGVRAHLERSLPDPTRALARAYFELWLTYRALAYGSRAEISLETPTSSSEREARARRYFVASERRGLRSRSLMLLPDTPFRPASTEQRDELAAELRDEIARLKAEYPEEWAYFGDVTPSTVARRVAGRQERPWFSAEWPDGSVKSVSALATAFGHAWEYEYLYDAFSALIHSRGIRHDVTLNGSTLAVHHPHDPTWFTLLAFFVTGWHLLFLITAAKWSVPEMIPQLQGLHLRHAAAINSIDVELPPLLS